MMNQNEKWSILSLVFGIISLGMLVFSIFWIPAVVGLGLAIAGLVLSLKVKKENRSKAAKGGFVTSLIGVILCGVLSVSLAWPFFIATGIVSAPMSADTSQASSEVTSDSISEKTIEIGDISFCYPSDWTWTYTDEYSSKEAYDLSINNNNISLGSMYYVEGGTADFLFGVYDFVRLENVKAAGYPCYCYDGDTTCIYTFDTPDGCMTFYLFSTSSTVTDYEEVLSQMPDVLKSVKVIS